MKSAKYLLILLLSGSIVTQGQDALAQAKTQGKVVKSQGPAAQTKGDFSPIFLYSTINGSVNLPGPVSNYQPTLNRINSKLDALYKKDKALEAKFEQGFKQVLEASIQIKPDMESTKKSLENIEHLLSDLNDEPVVVNNGTISTSNQTGGITANSVTYNGTQAQDMPYLELLKEFHNEGTSIKSLFYEDCTEAQYKEGGVYFEDWSKKVSSWIEKKMGRFSANQFLDVSNRPLGFYPWAGEHLDEDHRNRNLILTKLVGRLDNLKLLMSDPIYVPRQ